MTKQTQRWGRFGFIPPEGMQLRSAAHQLRYADVAEVAWPEGVAASDAAAQAWEARLAQLRAKLIPPPGVGDAIIETRTFAGDDRIHAAVCYHHDEDFAEDATWLVLAVDAGGGLWVERDSLLEASELLLERVLEVARAYQNPGQPNAAPEAQPADAAKAYHLAQGWIALPYRFAETLYLELADARREQVLTVETVVIDENTPDPPHGLIERLTGVVASGFADGVNIDRLAEGPRTVADLDGEEIAVRVDERGKILHNFLFEYPGEIEDGDRPRLRLDLTLPAGDVDSQRERWTALLDSFEALGR